jgi:hypothetical protein
MKTKILLFLLLSLADMIVSAQVADFENQTLAPESYWAGQDGSADFFIDSEIFFPTSWDTSFGGYWLSGWAYSNKTDSITSGYENEFSAKAGSGYNNSVNYAVALGDGYFRPTENVWQYFELTQFKMTNSTYAFNSMRDGDLFAKKFGGLSGDDPDFFTVTFRGFIQGLQVGNDVVVYLADFRFEDNSQDYIVRDWINVDLSGMNFTDSIAYFFESSDVGEFGINTPKYFCADHFEYALFINQIQENLASAIQISPNPATNYIRINGEDSDLLDYEIYNIGGQLIQTGCLSGSQHIDLSAINNGMYFLNLRSGTELRSGRFVVAK